MASLRYALELDASQATRAINDLKGALAGLASAFALRELAQFSDGITSLRNRLLTLTPDVQLVNQQFKALASIAIEARTPLNATADLFFRISRSAKELGISQREAAQITSSVAKALSASGQSAAEASGPLLQLGQALQSGTFQGDELRSILEGLPPVARALADELGVPVGALKKLGSEGQISADVFVKAMRRAKDSIDEAFGRTAPTIAQSIEALKTNAALVFDEFEKNTQTGRNLGLAIEYIGFQIFKLSKNIDEILEPLATFVKIILSLTAARIVIAIIGSIGAAVAAVTGFFTRLGAQVSIAIDFIKNFGAVISAVGANFTGFSAVIGAILKPIFMIGSALAGVAAAIYTFLGIDELIDKFKNLGNANSEGAKELEAYREELRKMREGLDDTAQPAENARVAAEELAKAMAKVQLAANIQTSALDRTLSQTRERLALEIELSKTINGQAQFSQDQIELARELNSIDIERRNAIQQIKDTIAKLNQEYSQLVVKDSQRGRELKGQIGIEQNRLKEVTKLYDQHEQGMSDLITNNQRVRAEEDARRINNETIIKLIDQQIKRNEDFGRSIRNINSQIAEQARAIDPRTLVGASALDRQIAEIAAKSREAGLKAQQEIAQAFESDDILSQSQVDDFVSKTDTMTSMVEKLKQSEIDRARVNTQLQQDFSVGWADAFARYRDSALAAADQSKLYFDTFTKGIEDAMVNFVRTGKLSFKDLANNLIAEFVRIQTRAALMRMLPTNIGGGAGGGLFDIVKGIGSAIFGGFRASGGPVYANKAYMVGERGPEMFVPNSAGSIVPNGAMNQQPIVNQVTYSIQAVDAMSFRQMVARDPEFIYNVTEQARRNLPQRSRR